MRVALDVRTAFGSGAGSKYHCTSLARWLPIVAPHHEFVGVTLRSFRNSPPRKEVAQLGIPVVSSLVPSSIAHYAWNRSMFWTPEWFPRHFDVYCQTDCATPPLIRKRPYVAFIHDLAFVRYPELYLAPQRFLEVLRVVEQRADVVVADSEHTRQDIIELTRISGERIRVVYCAVEREDQPAESIVRELQCNYKLSGPYFLSLGVICHKKNVVRLVKAYAQFRRVVPDPPSLVFAGSPGDAFAELQQTVNDLDLRSSVRFLGYLPREHITPLFYGASALLYPSLYEGFGLPPLQAMSLGVPVLTSRTSSLPEVVGDAAILVEPYSEREIADGLHRLWSDDRLRAQLIELGFRQAEKFSWAESCRTLVRIFEAL